MATLSTNVMVLFFCVSALVFLWSFIRDKEWTQLSASALAPGLKAAAIIVVPFLVLFAAAQFGSMTVAPAVCYFAPALFIPFIVSRLNFLPWQRGLLLLVMFVAATLAIPAESHMSMAALIGGLLTWKLADNLLVPERSTLEDVLPSLIWLVTVYWTAVGGGNGNAANEQALVLGTLAVSILIRWVQRPLLHEDKVYLKRVVLSIFGGLAVLCLITKVVAAVALTKIAAIAGAGYFIAYLFQATDSYKDEGTIRGLKQLLFIGILTLLASRLFGMLGVLVVAATMLVATKPGTAQIAGIFFVVKVFIQTFVAQYNPNVTGVNLLHNYTSATLYAGFLAVVIFSLFIRDSKDKRILAMLLIGGSVVLPAGSNFFVHPEPTSSLLISASVGAVILCTMATGIYQRVIDTHENLILIPAVMTASAVLSNELLQMGEQSSSQERLIAVGVLAFIVMCIGVVNHFIVSGPKDKTMTPVSNDVTNLT